MYRIILHAGIIAAGLMLTQLPAHSEQFTSQSNITSVTVFPSGAQVTRKFTTSLKPGRHIIVLNGLPTGMVSDSVVVHPESGSGVRIESIDVKYLRLPEDQQPKNEKYNEIADRIKDLESEKADYRLKIRSAQRQLGFITKLADMPASKTAQAGTNWSDIFELITQKSKVIDRKIYDSQIKIRELNQKITGLRRDLATLPRKSVNHYQVKIHLTASNEKQTGFSLRYQVSSASWQQLYEAHLNTKDGIEKATLKIVRKASIRQRSGESWENVKLTLSTTSPTQGTSQPNLNPLKLVLRAKSKNKRQSPGTSQRYQRRNATNLNDLGFQRVEREVNTGRRQIETAFHSVFVLPETISLDSSGTSKQIPMGTFKVKPTLGVVAVPRQKKLAYLSAKFTMPKKLNSSRGKAVIYRDGAYIGTGWLPNLNAGTDYYVGFGVDNKVLVKHVEINRARDKHSGLLSSTNSDERHFKITIKNLHEWKIPVTIIDRYPFAHDKDIEIKVSSKTTTPTRKNLDDKRGIVSWEREIAAGGQESITFAYKITWPGDRTIDVDRRYIPNEIQLKRSKLNY